MNRGVELGRRLWTGGPGWVVVAAAMLLGVGSAPLVSQTGQGMRDLAGTWQGTLQAGKGQRIVVKIAKDGPGWKGVVYNLDADMAWEGRATTAMSLAGAELRFAIAPIDSTYQGKLSEDGAMIGGTWTASGKTYTLSLARAVGDAQWEIPKATAAMAKDADPDWEVATVRPGDPNGQHQGFHLEGRQIFIERQTVEAMLELGYNVHLKQIVGAPDWIGTERWDVKGVPDVAGQPSMKQYLGMVRKVLMERFGLQTHTEKRELPVYAITVAKSGGKLVKSAGDPNGLMDEEDRGEAGQRTLKLTNVSLGEFAEVMKFFLDRPVVDLTGLPGKYDLRLKWTFDEDKAPTDGSAAPSMFTAVQEQLGLKLEPVKAPADVLVIDHMEKPSAN